MNILMVSYWDFQKEGMQVTLKTPLYFAKNGHKINFFVHSEQTTNPSQLTNIHPNINVYRFDLPLKFISNIPKLNRIRQIILFKFYCLYTVFRIYKFRSKPDLIYAAECDAILIGRILKYIFRVPLVTRYYGISNILLENPYRHFLYFLSLKVISDLAIVTDDGTNGRETLKNINPHIKYIKFWKNGIEPLKIEIKKTKHLKDLLKIQDKQVVLLTVSRLYGWKRVDRAIRLLSVLNQDLRKKTILLIVGEGPERINLEKLARKLRVFDSVLFRGKVPHTEIYNYYRIADIFLSLYDMSNVGNPLLEALNAHLPIITINTGETEGVIKNGENGILIEFVDNEKELAIKLANAVEKLCEDEKLQSKIKKGAEKYAKKNLLTWDERLSLELKAIENFGDKKGEK